MNYPSPIVVRTVKNELKNAAVNAGMAGASSLVNVLVGSMWGTIFNSGNTRNYMNFISELAGRTISPEAKTVYSRVVYDEHRHYEPDGKTTARFPVVRDGSSYYNQDGDQRKINKSYDSLSYDNRDTAAQNWKISRYNNSARQNNNNHIVKNNNNNHNTNTNQQQNFKQTVKPRHFSALEIAINDIYDESKVPRDFGIKDWLKSIWGIFNTRKVSDEEFGKGVLKGCYEYLEETGYDGQQILVDALEQHSNQTSFSEQLPIDLDQSDILKYRAAALMYSGLTESQKQELTTILSDNYGTKLTKNYTNDLTVTNQQATLPKPKRTWIYILTSIVTVSIALMRKLFTRPPKTNG